MSLFKLGLSLTVTRCYNVIVMFNQQIYVNLPQMMQFFFIHHKSSEMAYWIDFHSFNLFTRIGIF